MEEQEIHLSGESTITRSALVELYHKYIVDPIKRLFIENKEETEEVFRTVYCDTILFNTKGEFLILQRSYQDTFCPGDWSLPGGKLEIGEDFIEGAKRELEEETGIKVTQLTEFSVPVLYKEDAEIHYFQGLIDKDILITLDNDEHYRYSWIRPKDIPSINFLKDLGQFLEENLTFFDIEEITKEEVEEVIIQEIHGINPFVNNFNDISPLEESYQIIKSAFDEGEIDADKFLNYTLKYNQLKQAEEDQKIEDMIKSNKDLDSSNVDDNETESSDDPQDEDTEDEQSTSEQQNQQPDEEKLRLFAQQAPEENLLKTIKSSQDPKLREIAHQELDRRKKEEHIQEEKEDSQSSTDKAPKAEKKLSKEEQEATDQSLKDQNSPEKSEIALQKVKHFLDDKKNVNNPFIKDYIQQLKEAKKVNKEIDPEDFQVEIPEDGETEDNDKRELKKSFEEGYLTVEEYLEHLIKSRTQEGTYANTTQNRYLGIVGQQYKRGIQDLEAPNSKKFENYVNETLDMELGHFYPEGLNDQQLTALDKLVSCYGYTPENYQVKIITPIIGSQGHFVELNSSDTGNYIISTSVKINGSLNNTFYNFKNHKLA